jgi:hypothetical protein
VISHDITWVFHTWLDGTKSSKCGGDALQDGDGGFPATHHCGRSAAEHLVPGGMTMVGGCEVLGDLENMKDEAYEEYDCILCMVHLYLLVGLFILCFFFEVIR